MQENRLSPSQIEVLRLAASKMRGAQRRNFQAEIALKYCCCLNGTSSFAPPDG
ncbi:hypothetical protein [Microcoleus sp. FACHB-SPT15]|uniref:hypothetical protein n=1 Tax=Microcoleus sp. FACHB-SPT15 TaxID=2692830 RepID=UPI001A7E350C|nr:hypothetical protein [Microcoleus sp. FACHB-SPT15]